MEWFTALLLFHNVGRGMESIINFNVGVLGHVDSGKTSLGVRPGAASAV